MIEYEDDDTLHTMLFARIETLQAERDALAEENERIRAGIKTARDYAGSGCQQRAGWRWCRYLRV